MENYLYFAKANAPDATEGDEEVIMIAASKLSHFEMQTATRIKIFFVQSVQQEASQDGEDGTVVALDITTGTHKAVFKAIANAISDGANNGGFTVVADSANSVFVHADITLCAGIDVIDV